MFLGRWDSGTALPEIFPAVQKGNVLFTGDCQVYERSDTTVLFFGEIYNKKELGFSPDISDAQVVFELFNESGITEFSKLDGAYTCILLLPDITMIMRDHHGVSHQVYYTESCFSSSLSCLQQTPGVSFSPDYKSLGRFLSLGYVATPFSAFASVKKLGAGEILSVKRKNFERMQLFPADHVLPVINDSKTVDEYAEQYSILHQESIQRRIKGSVNVGLLLSGGYDSGCNLAALRKIYTGDVYSYSIGFKGDNWTELPLARCMSETFQTIHAEYEIDGSEIKALPDIINYLGDPFVEGGLMVNYAAMRLIGSEKPDVILGGDGSDQYFGTSGREVALHYLVSCYGLKHALTLLFSVLNSSAFDKNNSFYRLRFHLDKILHILEGDLFGFQPFQLSALLSDKSYLSKENVVKPDLRSFEHLYTQHAYKSDLEKIINQVIVFKASKMAAMFDNRLAFPYLDNTLYEFLKFLPVGYKCKGKDARSIAKGDLTAKYLLKYVYKPQLPEMITSKKKQGGFAPMPIFFKDDATRGRLADYIMHSSIVGTYLRKDAVELFIRQYEREVHADGNWFWYKQNKAIQYFNLLTLSIWWDQFVEGKRVTL